MAEDREGKAKLREEIAKKIRKFKREGGKIKKIKAAFTVEEVKAGYKPDSQRSHADVIYNKRVE